MGIHAYVSATVHRLFQSYASSLGLKIADVAHLLILRELLQAESPASEGSLTGDRPADGPSDKKVTVYPTSISQQRFSALAKSRGMSTSELARRLIERELEDRWLATVLRRPRDGSPSTT